MVALGIDIGGTGIKGAPVDCESGSLLAERLRIATPDPAAPDPVADAVAEIARHFAWSGHIGCGFPGIIKGGTVYSAANIDKSWIGKDASALFGGATTCPVTLINDADGAGLAEMLVGAGKGRHGVVFVLTLGTGIGTALFTDGHLVPNVELGHLTIRGKDAEARASALVRETKKLSWKQWARRLSEFLKELERLFSPSLFIIGGGVSKKGQQFLPLLDVETEVVPAQLRNNAGIVGAAIAASRKERGTSAFTAIMDL